MARLNLLGLARDRSLLGRGSLCGGISFTYKTLTDTHTLRIEDIRDERH